MEPVDTAFVVCQLVCPFSALYGSYAASLRAKVVYWKVDHFSSFSFVSRNPFHL